MVSMEPFDPTEIVAFRKCSGDPDEEDVRKSHCIWKKGFQTCQRCEKIAPAHYWKDKGNWVKTRNNEEAAQATKKG